MADPIAPVTPMPEVAPATPPPAPVPTHTPGAGAPYAPAPAPAAPPTEFELRPEYELQHPDLGRPVKVADLITSYRDADLIRRAEAGDQAAQEALLGRLANKIMPGRGPNPAPANPQTPPAQPGTPPQEFPLSAQEAREMKEFVSQQRSQFVRAQMGEALKHPEYRALAERGVDYVLDELNKVHATLPPGTKITPQVIVNTLKTLSQREQAYVDRILAPYREQAGELGADDPFRGGQPDPSNDPRPNSQKEPQKYQQWLARQVAFARRQERLAQAN